MLLRPGRGMTIKLGAERPRVQPQDVNTEVWASGEALSRNLKKPPPGEVNGPWSLDGVGLRLLKIKRHPSYEV